MKEKPEQPVIEFCALPVDSCRARVCRLWRDIREWEAEIGAPRGALALNRLLSPRRAGAACCAAS